MAAGRDSVFDVHLTNLVDKSSFDGILYRKMAFFISSFWFHIISFLFSLFGFIAKHVFRIKREDCSPSEDFKVMEGEQSVFQEEETQSLSFKFEYQMSDVGSLSSSEEPAVVPSMVTNISKYCFLSENDFRGFVQEPESVTFHIQESFVDPGDENFESKLSLEKDVEQLQKKFSTMGKNKFLAEEFSGFDSDSESSTSDGYSVKNLIIDSDSDGILSDIDCGGYECESDSTEVTMNSKSHKPPKFHTSDSSDDEGIEWSFDAAVTRVSDKYSCSPDKIPVNKSSNSDEESCHHMLKLKETNGVAGSSEIPESEEAQLASSIGMLLEFMDSSDDEALSYANKEDTSAVIECEKENNAETVQKFETSHSKDSESEEFDDELETLWEHQDLIEQLKMELKKARGIGLPTILEESESPKSVDDLKPWKIDEKFSREDPMDELRKFYKCYRERMRKLDILNYQKMYSIGFLQLKDALQSLGSQKPLIQTMTSILSQNLWPFRHRQCTNDSSKKFIRELQSELEMVYVGQTCLSWEFLRWQYEKAHQLLHPNTYRTHQYNHVAEELQQFQVIVQRFLENEAFQGPRLPNYVKNRCVLRNLLQVPLIKEDCMKDKMEKLKKGNNAITGEMLEDIMEESINVLWDFIKSDKDETPVILRGLLGTQVELQDPSDFKIMVDAQAILLKKERKLKDVLRTGNCLVKKFKKPREDRSNQEIFFSQVDLKLVSRVLKMPRITTDQLIWCHKKLHKITFSERKVQREMAFLLFPC